MLVFPLIISAKVYSQSTFEYRRNAISGLMEVYEKSNTNAYGVKVGELNRNAISGYYELKTFNQSVKEITVTNNYYTNRPIYQNNYSSNHYEILIQQLNALNQQAESKNLSTSSNQSVKDEIKKNELEYNDKIIENLFKFYSSQKTYPTIIKDGYYEVMEINESDRNSKLMKQFGNIDVKLNYTHENAIVKVQNNKIVEYYRSIVRGFNSSTVNINIFHKLKLDLISPIKDCKSTYRFNNEIRDVYFINNLINENCELTNPNFNYYTIYTDKLEDDYDTKLLQIARNEECNSSQMKYLNFGAYILNFDKSNKSSDFPVCNETNLTLAFKNINSNFSIGILYKDKEWHLNNINFDEAKCKSTILTIN